MAVITAFSVAGNQVLAALPSLGPSLRLAQAPCEVYLPRKNCEVPVSWVQCQLATSMWQGSSDNTEVYLARVEEVWEWWCRVKSLFNSLRQQDFTGPHPLPLAQVMKV